MNPRMLPLVRGLHIFAAVYNILFVYTSLHDWSYGFGIVQYVTLPLLLITGVLLVRLRKQPALARM